MDNKKGNCCACPARMSSGNFISNYKSIRNVINKEVKKSNKITNHHDYRQFLQQNANQIMTREKIFLDKNFTCDFAKKSVKEVAKKVKKTAKKPAPKKAAKKERFSEDYDSDIELESVDEFNLNPFRKKKSSKKKKKKIYTEEECKKRSDKIKAEEAAKKAKKAARRARKKSPKKSSKANRSAKLAAKAASKIKKKIKLPF
jgi:hypothetical protein